MGDLTVLKGKIEKYRNLLSKAETQETIEEGLANEIAKFEISFENDMAVNQNKFTEIVKMERDKIDKSQKDINTYFDNFRENIESGKSSEDIAKTYSLEILEDSELRLSEIMKQEDIYMEYLELQEKRIDLDMDKGLKIHEIRYELDNGYKQEIDYHRLMDKWERQAQKVYETEPDGMYV